MRFEANPRPVKEMSTFVQFVAGFVVRRVMYQVKGDVAYQNHQDTENRLMSKSMKLSQTHVTGRRNLNSTLMLMLSFTLASSTTDRTFGQETHLTAPQLYKQFDNLDTKFQNRGAISIPHRGSIFDWILGERHYPNHHPLSRSHYQGVIRHRDAVYISSSFREDDRGGRILVVENERQSLSVLTRGAEAELPNTFVKNVPTKAVKEIWDIDLDAPNAGQNWHYGGMDTSHDVLAVATYADIQNLSMIHLFDVSEAREPVYLHSVYTEGMYNAGAVGITRDANGTWLVAVGGKIRLNQRSAKIGFMGQTFGDADLYTSRPRSSEGVI